MPPDSSWAVAKKDWPQVSIEFSGDEKTRVLRASEVEVRIEHQPFNVGFYNRKGELISRVNRVMAWHDVRVRCWKAMPPGEDSYGLGEKPGTLAKRGHSYLMWNTDPAANSADTEPRFFTRELWSNDKHGQCGITHAAD